MKQFIANSLLVAGVIVAALAAGESQRVSRAAPVDDRLVGQVLHARVATHAQAQHPGVFVYRDRALAANTTLSAEDVTWLRELGLHEVLVLRRKTEQETLPLGPEVQGRVLAEAVLLSAEEEEISPGRLITSDFAARLRGADLESLQITAKRPLPGGGNALQEVLWPLKDDEAAPEGLSLIGSYLRQTVSLPVQLKPSSYVDAELFARLEASGLEELALKIPKVWKFEDWQDRWRFLVGLGLTLLGVVLRRSKPGAQAAAQGQLELARLAAALVSLEGEVERWVQSPRYLDPEALQEAIDPLLAGPIYQIAEGRYAIRAVHGSRVFCAVMDAFARGERKLNRAWSAAVDGHAEESRASLSAALPALREAREALPGTYPPPPSGFEAELPGQAPLPPDVPLASGMDHWADEES